MKLSDKDVYMQVRILPALIKKENTMEYLLKWICGWANLADGLCLIFTLGFYCLDLSYYAECTYLDYMADRIKKP